MSDNLVDSMLEEMQMNNNPADMNYAPAMGGMGAGAPPIQAQGNVNGMGGLGYDPQMGGPGQMPPQMTSSQAQMAMYQDSEQMPEGEMMGEAEAPDMSNYGMNEGGGWLPSGIIDSFKDPLMVIILAVILSLPQVNRLIRGTLSQFVGNPYYVSILQAVMLGLAFYLLKMLI